MRFEVRGRIPCCAVSTPEQTGPGKSPHADEVLTRQGLLMQAGPVAHVDEAHVVHSDAMD